MNRSVQPSIPHPGTQIYDEPGTGGQCTVEGGEPASAAVGHRLRVSLARLSWLGRIGLFIVCFWLVMAIVGPMLAPYNQGTLASPFSFASYSMQHPFGTDYLGRDMLSRILNGARYTVGLALAAAVLASGIGTCLGLLTAAAPRWVDEAMSRFFDALISIPSKVLALVAIAAFGSSVPMLTAVAAVAYVPGAFRISRSLAINLMTLEYVQVARARGEGWLYIARVELLPNMIHPVLADFGLRFVFIVLLLSGLSFLGLGVQPPNADWGSLVRENIGGLSQAAPAVLMPSVAIATLTVGMNLLIDSLRRHGGFAQGGVK
ncbi:ABC transporter permease [Trinickia diaoshuihuensis]|jgi:peptide/nickel transport system permease protein|uniref:ABC transporter permease n=1 Tax=Trinickia diaoshuihuensis TaxID=2292265 RepID=UPI000E24984D|nr:ABC transporter permease [Trinickia diaoshuihuensis]